MHKKWLVSLSVTAIIIVLFLYSLGFRITYAPELENSWAAIDAVGTWAGVLSPLFLAIINTFFARDVEKTKQEIISSNRVIFEQNLANGNEGSLTTPELLKKTIIDYIMVNVTVSTEDIAALLKKDTDEVYGLLSSMEREKLIVELNQRSTIEKSKRMWKVKQ